ncbi:MAG TPA: class D sortase [Bryobacteraceae bacterium]|nr:class D sortase [Bryobacteraceae bacterium]
MRAHALWSDSEPREPGWVRTLAGVEWIFLLFGLAALDLYIWNNASSMVYESYEDWAFDQDVRGLEPSPLRFALDELRVLVSREHRRSGTQALAPVKSGPGPRPKAMDTGPRARSGVIGRLEIPNLHLVAIVEEGADAGTLRRAVGHIPGTALPGWRGNVGLAGHRDTFFRALREIQVNDSIELKTQNGTYRYRVNWMRIVGPRDVQVLRPSTAASLTLVTCYPFYYVGSAPKRFVVRAGLEPGVPSNSPSQLTQ